SAEHNIPVRPFRELSFSLLATTAAATAATTAATAATTAATASAYDTTSALQTACSDCHVTLLSAADTGNVLCVGGHVGHTEGGVQSGRDEHPSALLDVTIPGVPGLHISAGNSCPNISAANGTESVNKQLSSLQNSDRSVPVSTSLVLADLLSE